MPFWGNPVALSVHPMGSGVHLGGGVRGPFLGLAWVSEAHFGDFRAQSGDLRPILGLSGTFWAHPVGPVGHQRPMLGLSWGFEGLSIGILGILGPSGPQGV